MTITINDRPETSAEVWHAECRAEIRKLQDAEERRRARNAYVVSCLRKGMRPDPQTAMPDEGYIIAETPRMYRD